MQSIGPLVPRIPQPIARRRADSPIAAPAPNSRRRPPPGSAGPPAGCPSSPGGHDKRRKAKSKTTVSLADDFREELIRQGGIGVGRPGKRVNGCFSDGEEHRVDRLEFGGAGGLHWNRVFLELGGVRCE